MFTYLTAVSQKSRKETKVGINNPGKKLPRRNAITDRHVSFRFGYRCPHSRKDRHEPTGSQITRLPSAMPTDSEDFESERGSADHVKRKSIIISLNE